MKKVKISGRQLKQKIRRILEDDDFEQGLDEIRRLPPRQAVNPLFSFLCSLEETVKWRAITAIGKVISDLAACDLESARVVMRRFIWHLNDESGGIGWGCPESMAEVMAQNEKLAREYGDILISYIQPGGNYMEHEVLQRGVLWGVGRLAHTRPRYTQNAAAFLLPYMESEDPNLRGLAVWAVSPQVPVEIIPRLKQLTKDPSEFVLYQNGRLDQVSVGQLARSALAAVDQ
ncbi:MAG: HEAT repeat domain-containing protein [Desulfobacterales bacterium]|nr:HEAT repeat domain-containing protein [Desulfobacterales bacterium]